jgi:nitric oxide reductase NorQ protein
MCLLLVRLANRFRSLKGQDIDEGASTRLIVYCATLMAHGMKLEEAISTSMIEPLTDDPDVRSALLDITQAVIG